MPPPPSQSFRKEMDNILLHFYVHFRRVFVEFVVLLTKILPKNIDFHRYSYNVLERAVFAPPPPGPSHQEMIDAI